MSLSVSQVTGLDPDLSYEFRFLGSRSDAETRVTEYAVYGTERQAVTLQTSGTGIGSTGSNANDDDVAVVSGVRPDQFGQVWVDVTLKQGSYAYLNAMEVVASTPAGGTMSAAVTSPAPCLRRYITTGSSFSDETTSCLMLRMSSVTSSLTPGTVENSCSTPSMRMLVTAAPGIDDSSVRRSELPSV